MRRHWLGIAVLALATGTASAQLDPASGQPAATLLPPLPIGLSQPMPPPALPPPPPTDKGTSTSGERPLPKTQPQSPITPANYNVTPWPCHDYQPQPSRGCQEWCAPQPCIWVDTDYLLWWMRSASVPALVTISPMASAEILGQPGTVSLAGGSNVNLGAFSGLRLGAGCWLDEFQTIGLEGNWFFFGSRSWAFAAGNNGDPSAPVVARPFFNALSNSEDSELAELGGLLAGAVQVNVSSRLDGWEVNGVCNLSGDSGTRLDLLAGFRSLELNDGVTVLEDMTVLSTGNRFQVADEFHGRSTMYAGQLGARFLYQSEKWDAKLTGKVALGCTHEEVAINGQTGLTPPGGPTTVVPGGLLALPSNMGQYSRDVFAVVPEVGFRVGYQVTNMIHLGVGYSFLYWSNVVRAGDQIDRMLNPSQIPALQGAGSPADRPAFSFRETAFWAHGLTASVEFHY